MTWLDVYFWCRDQGSNIAGGLALLAGVAAYIAGERQAKATRDAAKSQKDDFREQQRAAALGARKADIGSGAI